MFLFLSVFFLLVAVSTPISIALGITAVVMLLQQTDLRLLVVAQRMFTGIDSFPLMAIPFFILSGHLMNAGGTTHRLITFCNALVGSLRGGLANISIAGNMIMAGISGSSVADASALGSIIIPAMKKEGYDADYAAAINATASTIGIIIPPSIPMILLGVVASVSIRDLFIGGAIPGVITGLILMSISTHISRKRGYPKHDRVPLRETLRLTVTCMPALLMPIAIVGGIVLGIFTPTEAAVIAVIYALVIGFAVYRELTWQKTVQALYDTGQQTAVVLLVISTASVVSWLLAYNLVPQGLARTIASYDPSPTTLLAIIAGVCLITGTVIDVAPAIILLGSVFAPVAFALHVDPVHFGVLLVYAMAIGLFTPPVGTTLILSCYIADTTLFHSFKSCLPFLVGMVAVLAALVLFKDFALFLPNLLFH
ncbi:MAG: TRAP transporter large permease [Candidatus Methylomirabilales bacterium]